MGAGGVEAAAASRAYGGAMGRFGKKEDEAANQQENDRLAALSLDALAAEVLPHIPGIDLRFGSKGPTDLEVAKEMAPSKLKGQPAISMTALVAEGLQVLEHAGLVRLGIRPDESNSLEYALTRAGQTAIDQGDVATRLRGV